MEDADDSLEQRGLERNLRIFVWYRVFFNARFYYPVFAIFFTDLGLATAQFLWLNAIWALTIVLFEVPSGVLADLLGRRRLVIFSAVSMLIEMLLLILAPQHGGWGLFAICAVNRVLSGLAEAAASGADEALAYDSLEKISTKGDGIAELWDNILIKTMRWRSLAGLLAMLVGGLVYDHELAVRFFGEFPRILSIKMPIILCFFSACICLVLSLRLVDPQSPSRQKENSISDIGRGILDAGSWVLKTRWIAILLLASVIIDGTARNFATLQSEYFRYISLPEFSFGFIGAAMSLAGLFVPMYARVLAQKFSPWMNMALTGFINLLGLAGVAFFNNWIGIVASLVVMMSLVHVGFLMSRYINRDAPSEKRASILSVNSLVLNLGYGLFSALFAMQVKRVGFGDALHIIPIVLLGFLFLWMFARRIACQPSHD